MSEEERHANRRSTGTVPKQRNNYSRPFTDVERLRSLSNSSSDCYPSRDSSNELKNPRRSNQIKDLIIESTLEDQNFPAPPVGYVTLNSIGSSNHSSPTSRRNSSSSTLKCDNLTKYPNKKQIEDKLNQIHEYLKVTNSLMASMKKTDDQVPSRIDEFSAEGAFLSRKNDENANLENVSYNLGILKERQQTGYQFRRKSENKRSSPGRNQSNILEVCNDVHSPSNKDVRNYVEFGTGSKERTEHMKKTVHPQSHTLSNQDKSFGNIDSLHNHIISLHNSNDENERLLETLDGTDSELATEHAELHKKLIELQNRKFQIDRLVAQLQSFGDSYEDTDSQYKKICAMKEQLNKLKDMLEVVKMPDNVLQNTNNPFDDRKASCYLCSSTEFNEKDVKKPKLKARIHNDSNMFRNANITSRDSRPKQLNTNSRERGNQVNKANMSSIAQKIALQTELECKKRELEEIMGKHKGNASNLNQDVGIDTKSEISSVANGLNEPWASIISHESDSDRFSSDDCQEDTNNYSDLKHNFLSLPSLNYSPSSVANCQSEHSQRSNYAHSTEFQPLNGLSYTSEPHFRSNSVGATSHLKKSRRSNSEESNSNQVQKQLQMIRSMCDSMLEHQISQEPPSNRQQVRNNLIPSPQRFVSPHAQRPNTGNITNPNTEVPSQWFPTNMCNSMNNDVSSYYNWLTNNTIQTQSFMLNTLNQCYQMLWIQQRELAVLKNNMSMLQERLKNCTIGPSNTYSSASLHVNSQPPPNRRMHHPETDHKINQDGGFTIPMSEQFDCPLPNMPLNCLNNSNSQLLDSCLNNMNVNRLNVQHNTTESSIPGNINHLPNHIWSGQALNNQVVPGNRANNYWDNFRSYSRQNLLSTKNSEMLQNLPSVIDRSNFVNHCVNPFAFISFSKSNSEQDSTSTSQENTPQRTTINETGPNTNLDRLHRGAAGDSSNINISMRDNEPTESPSKDIGNKGNNDIYYGLPAHLNVNNAMSLDHSNISENHIVEETKRRNENVAEVHPMPKPSFDDMRESVYKEVASLISANENRPQFLIQLFRDLQMIRSDNGRFNILQSIERNVTHHSVPLQNVKKHVGNPRKISIQSAPSLEINTSSNSSSNNEYTTHSNIFQEVQLFLEHHEEVVIQNQFVIALKKFLLSLESFKEISKDSVFCNHLDSSLDNELGKYYGKRLEEVKLQLLETVNYLIYEHLGLVRFNEEINNVIGSNCSQESSNVINTVAPAENGDLAEADQSQITNEDNGEEGAVGGVLDINHTNKDDSVEVTNSSPEEPRLDQTRSRSTTPTEASAPLPPYQTHELLQL